MMVKLGGIAMKQNKYKLYLLGWIYKKNGELYNYDCEPFEEYTNTDVTVDDINTDFRIRAKDIQS